MFFFKNRKVEFSPNKTNPTMLIHHLQRKVLDCRHCGEALPTREHEPLTVVPCPKCRREVLIPKSIRGYWLYREVGGGGMGRVYKAVTSDFPDQRFAVKLLAPEHRSNEALVEALHNEAHIVQRFQAHPNVVKSVEFGMARDDHFFATEFIEGERWDKRVERMGRIPPAELLPFIMDIISAVKFIYRSSHLHRDLKPENIIFNRNNVPILIDFGLCTTINDALHHATDEEVDGAPHFMAPERLTGEGENVWSEVYSIGMLMYYSLTGQTFFPSGEVQEVAEKYVYQDRTDSILPDIPDLSQKMMDVVHKAIQRQPTDRYHSFERLEADLRQAG